MRTRLRRALRGDTDNKKPAGRLAGDWVAQLYGWFTNALEYDCLTGLPDDAPALALVVSNDKLGCLVALDRGLYWDGFDLNSHSASPCCEV